MLTSMLRLTLGIQETVTDTMLTSMLRITYRLQRFIKKLYFRESLFFLFLT